jgi:hypothetical protein
MTKRTDLLSNESGSASADKGAVPTLQQALLQLEGHLELFGTAQNLLDQAQSDSRAQLESWRQLKADLDKERGLLLKDFKAFVEQQDQRLVALLEAQTQERDRLLATARESQATAGKLVANLDAVVGGLQELTRKVQEVGFPVRLEYIQTLVAGVQETVVGVQKRLDLQEKLQEGQARHLREAFDDQRDRFDKLAASGETRAKQVEQAVGASRGAVLRDIGERMDNLAAAMSDAETRLTAKINADMLAVQTRIGTSDTTLQRMDAGVKRTEQQLELGFSGLRHAARRWGIVLLVVGLGVLGLAVTQVVLQLQG